MISVMQAIALAIQAAEAGALLLEKAQKVGAAVAQAQKEGREELTEAEWMGIQLLDDQARAKLQDAINKADG